MNGTVSPIENMYKLPCISEKSGLQTDVVACKEIKNSDNAGAVVNPDDIEVNAGLSLALLNGCDIEAIRCLLEKGADVNKPNCAGRSPLCIALQHPDCNSDLVHLILKAGATAYACHMHMNLLDCYFATAKQIIPDVLKLLLEKQLGTRRLYKESLCRALSAETCRADVIKVLLEMGCGVNRCLLHASSFSCYFEENALTRSRPKDLDAEVIKLLLGRVTEARMVYGNLQSPLCLALNHSKCTLAIVKLFLEAGPSFRKCCIHKSCLHCFIDNHKAYHFYTSRSLNIDILKLFLDRGADIHEVGSTGVSALCMAMHHFDCSADVLELLLDAGARLNGCQLHGSVLMCYVVTNRVKADVIKLLLDRGADAYEVGSNGDTPLHSALRYSNYEAAALEMLINHPGFDVNQTGRNKSSYLHCALQNSYYNRNIVELLLNRGVRADALDSRGYTTLQIAVMDPNCDTDVLKLLLDNGCPLYTNNELVVTPLETVLRRTKRVDVVRLLLTSGAPVDVKRHANDPTLLEFAIELYGIMQKQDSLDCLEMFVKYVMLVYPDLDVNELINKKIRSYFKKSDLLHYVRRCENEIKRMDEQSIVPGLTLRHLAAGLKKDVMYDFDALLKILRSNEFPIYFDIISTQVSKELMKGKLHELHAYVITDLPCKAKRKIVLDNYSSCHINHFLSDNDLLSYLVVYYTSTVN